MSNRGRPKTPDVLTPREYEVLALLRNGLSNREIAGRLGISLAGAKFHVSEIIGKLGVESREEAAAWQSEPSRRWGFAPSTALSGAWSSSLSLFGMKVAVPAAALAVLAVSGMAFVLVAANGSDNDPDRTASAASATVAPTCAGCLSIQEVEYTTIEEAAVFASFVPMLPADMPGGFEEHRIVASERDFTNPYVPEVHNDWITIEYVNEEGARLVISQGFPAMVSAVFSVRQATGLHGGTLEVAGHEAIWSPSVPITHRFDPSDDLGLVLTLYVGRFGSGWGQDGSWFSGSPMTYSIASDSLDLETLIAIAESVSFPPMLQPLNDATPESIFD
jgi:DNA-binding CsgD family transcriptional regulator